MGGVGCGLTGFQPPVPASVGPRSCVSDCLVDVFFGYSVLQVVQIVLGVLSGVLGGFLYIYQFSDIRTTGAPIWTGVVVSMVL